MLTLGLLGALAVPVVQQRDLVQLGSEGLCAEAVPVQQSTGNSVRCEFVQAAVLVEL